jgi:hypothetical protein
MKASVLDVVNRALLGRPLLIDESI